jgi:hypothetical protein
MLCVKKTVSETRQKGTPGRGVPLYIHGDLNALRFTVAQLEVTALTESADQLAQARYIAGSIGAVNNTL